MEETLKSVKPNSLPQIFTIFVACLASITNGAQFAWSSPFIVKITKDKVNYNITEDEASHFTTIPPISGLLFSVLIPVLSDALGRRNSVIFLAVPQILFWILTAVATNVYVFYAARVVAGVGDAFHCSVMPIYLGEITTPKIRGKWANFVPFEILGQVLITLMGQRFSVVNTSIICSALPVLFVVMMLLMPESPYYCIIKNNDRKAEKALKYLRGKENVDIELADLKADVERQMSERGTWKELVFIPSNRIALIVGIFLKVSKQLSGIITVLSYNQYIFEKSGSDISSATSSLVTISLLCVVTFISGYVIEKHGRKKTYTLSMFGCGITFLLEAIYFYMDQNTTIDVNSMNWFPLLGMVLYITISAFGVTPIPALMIGELFSSSIKTKAAGILMAPLCMAIFAANSIFYALESNFGLWSPFLFFSICCFVSTVLAFFLVPETKGKTLEEVQQSLQKR